MSKISESSKIFEKNYVPKKFSILNRYFLTVVCEKKNSKIDKNPKNFRKFRAFEANKIAPVENFRKVFTRLERASSCVSFWKVWMVAEK